ncbi:hypothetical protein Tco_1018533 [Tanacetum coccineum]|uniref:Uncharacterized protein n=1 Tax=Tanacetum coccineum TaxID=301880 RepID=A0ABQ5FVZ9_9ASTR
MMRRYPEEGIPRVIILGLLQTAPYTQPVAPPSPDYIPGPEDPQTPPIPQDEDEHEFPAEEQPLPPVDSPTLSTRTMVSKTPKSRHSDSIHSGSRLIEVTAALPSPPLPPSLYIPPPVDRRDDIPESEQPPRKWLYLSTLGSKYEVEESSTTRPTRDRDPAEAVPEIASVTLGEVNTRVTELVEFHEHDTQDLYALLEDAQDSRSRISQRVDMDSQRVNLLMGDMMTLKETVWMVEEEAYASREAWAHSIGLSTPNTAPATGYSNSDTASETLRVIIDMRREMSDMQAELLSLREQQRRARQPGPEARIPDHQDAFGDADSHI